MNNLRRLFNVVAAALIIAPSPASAQQYRAATGANASLSGSAGAAGTAPKISLTDVPVSGAALSATVSVVPGLQPAPALLAPAAVTAPSPARRVNPAKAAAAAAVLAARAAAASATPAAVPPGAATPTSLVQAMTGPARTRAEELVTAFDLRSGEAPSAAFTGEAAASLPEAKAGEAATPATTATTPAPAAGTPRSTQGPLSMTDKNGVVHPLSYNPALPRKSLWKEAWEWITHLPSKIAGVRRYMKRTNELVEAITDEDLAWSLSRFGDFQNQEGILRTGNQKLVNNWQRWGSSALSKVMPDDFADASVSEISLRKLFKQAMDREEPTRAYGWTSSMNLHNYMPRVAHFMGVTFQERVIAIALRGEAPSRSVWVAEEQRHGSIMERVYNLSRKPGQPELVQQGISPTSPKPGLYSSSSMIANRSLAEIGAATAYLALKANARPGSAADKALEGIYRDEVYHYVLMNAARRWGLGIRGRLGMLWHILKHQFDNPLPKAVDAIVDERPGISPLVAFEYIYAFMKIDKRVARYLKTIPDAEGERLVGKVYRTEAEFEAAVASGDHTRTDVYPMEVNPELSGDDVRELARRFPTRFDASRRSLKASQVRDIIARYRKSLDNPAYWMRKKGFTAMDSSGWLRREIGAGERSVVFDLRFDRPEPTILIRVGEGAGKALLETTISRLSMRQLGAIFGAEDAAAVANISAMEADYTPTQIVGRMVKSASYEKDPIPVIED